MAAPVKESDYHLSTELTGHSGDVRGVAGLQMDETKATYIVTTSRDRTARVWLREDQREYKTVKVFRQHKGFVSCACVVPSDSEAGREKCCIATGSQDNTIMLLSLDGDSEGTVAIVCDNQVPAPLDADHCLTGHKGHVSCITYQCNSIISGSWDGTVKVWDLSSFTLTSSMAAHQPAVWAVSGLYEHDGTHRALSGGADRIIRLWELDTSLCVQEYSGHADVVRDVKVVSADVFLSASNDCVIRKWSIHSAQCLREFYGHQALAPTPGLEDDFASCGEDGTIRVWKGGACVQVIKLPCISVWCVCRMEGGDLVAGSSDGIARVFTTEPTRMALPEEIAAFQSKVDEYRSAASGGEQSIDVSSLPGMDALSQPGKKTGDTKLINNKGKAEVYQWDEDAVQWVKIGDAIGQAPKGGSVYMGQEYDYVFDIELDEGNPTMRKLKLPYNKTVDPYIAADEFLTANDLPAGYLDEVAEFIIKNADVDTAFSGGAINDPFTGGGRYVPGQGSTAGSSRQGEDPFTGSGRYVPGQGSTAGRSRQGEDPFTGSGRYVPGAPQDTQPTVSFTKGSRGGSKTVQPTRNPYFPLESMKTFTSPADYGTKVIAKIREFNTSLLILNDDQLQLLEAFSTSFSSRSVDALDLLFSLLSTWPQENVFPVLDLVRLAMLNKQCCDYLTTSDIGRDLFQLLIKLASGEAKNHLLVFRILSNAFSYDSGVQLMHSQRVQFFSALPGFMGIENRTNQIALATVILNHYYSQHIDQDGISDCVNAVIQVLKSQSQDNEAKFRVLVALGTMCQRCMAAVKSASTSIDYSSVLVPLCDVPDPLKISECALHLLELLL